jgi:hypothetical protein
MSTESAEKEPKRRGDEKTVTVKVNGTDVTIEKKATVGALLDEAGYASVNHYLVRVEHDKEVKEYRDVTEKITLHDGEEFRAYYNDATPLS